MNASKRLEDKLHQAVAALTADLTHEEQVEAFKSVIRAAIKEWLDEKIRDFGWWSFKTVAALAIAALAYFVLTHSGWTYGGK